MVEYVLGGSPTNKESPLTLEPRLRGLKIDEVKVCKQICAEKLFIDSLFSSRVVLSNSGQRR